MGLLRVVLDPLRRCSAHEAHQMRLEILQCGDLPHKYCSETRTSTLASLILLHKW